MNFYIKDILNFEFLFYLLIFIVVIIFNLYLLFRLYYAFISNKTTIKIVVIALLSLWIYYCSVNTKQELSPYSTFNSDFLLALISFILVFDLGVWIAIKFLDQFASINLERKLDQNNPRRLKSEIESLVNEQNFKENPEMIRLYEILQISVLSIKKQKKIIRSSFIKNMLISIFFFALGLIIPKIITFFI